MNYLEVVAFLSIAVIQTGSPGPSTLLVINNALNYGYKKSLIVLTGDLIATAIIGVVVSLGINILIAQYPSALPLIQILGGGYLFYIGIKIWKTSNSMHQDNNSIHIPLKSIWYKSFIVSISNPKAVIFFGSFFPIFISDTDNLYQIYVLLVLFIVAKFIVLGLYAVSTHIFSKKILKSASINTINKISAIIFCIFGLGVVVNSLDNMRGVI